MRDLARTRVRVTDPLRSAASGSRRVLATQWVLHARDEEEAWEVLRPWRGLRAPGRLEAVDPTDLRKRADQIPRDEVLSQYRLAYEPDAIVDAYRPLVDDLKADVVTFQMTSRDQEALNALLGQHVLPVLRQSSDESSTNL